MGVGAGRWESKDKVACFSEPASKAVQGLERCRGRRNGVWRGCWDGDEFGIDSGANQCPAAHSSFIGTCYVSWLAMTNGSLCHARHGFNRNPSADLPSMSSELSSAQIVRQAKSNLAFALGCLPPERKRDMVSFYAFCRVVDDIADDPGRGEEEKETELLHWRKCVLDNTPPGHAVLDEALVLPGKYGFPRAWLAEIIDGVGSDITKLRYETFEELLGYCYKVASVVGLVSIEIFGHEKPETRDYALNLGYALQLTNIMRDVGQDARETGRIYIPQEDLRQFHVLESDLLSGVTSERFVKMMDFQYRRARSYYQAAEKALPPEDRKSMVASQIMADIYSRILEKLKRERYQVFSKRCRLHSLHKAWILLTHMVRAKLGRY